ncbi:MAG: fructose-6-phosphate aldolase [Candidatus Nucleicultricaceae bacterium]
MKFFLDSADLKEISAIAETGLIDGVTTNPTLIAKSGQNIQSVIKSICDIIKGPVSAEVTATETDLMMKEADVLRNIAPNVVIKVPLTVDGLKTCRKLSAEGTPVNVTLCFSAPQAILAAKAGAAYISPFMGRLDDMGQDSVQLIEEICHIYNIYVDFETEVLAASIRHPIHLLDAAKAGADVATLPAKVFYQLYQHPLTDKGLALFIGDWKKTGQSIL